MEVEQLKLKNKKIHCAVWEPLGHSGGSRGRWACQKIQSYGIVQLFHISEPWFCVPILALAHHFLHLKHPLPLPHPPAVKLTCHFLKRFPPIPPSHPLSQ